MEIDTLYNADCIEFMKQMDDCSVDFTLTDIPYGYVNEHVDKDKCQEKAKHLFVGDADVETFDLKDFLPEVKRVTKNSALVFCGKNGKALLWLRVSQGVFRQGESPLGQGWLSKKPF